MTTFYDLIKDLANHIADVRSSTAESGTTATLVDSLLLEPNDYYNNGTLLIDQATPLAVRITDYASATGTFTFPTINTAIVAGVGYTAIHAKFPLDVLKRSINAALLESELIMAVDETLALVAGQERYALPTGVTPDVRRVEIGTEDEDNWEVHYAWKVEGGELRFIGWVPEDASKTCRIHYTKRHDELTNLTDTLDENVNRNRLIVTACKHTLIWRNYKVGKDEPNTTELLNFYMQQAERVKNQRTSHLLERDPLLARY